MDGLVCRVAFTGDGFGSVAHKGCRLSGKGEALGGVATFAGVGLGIVASLASFNSFDVHLMF